MAVLANRVAVATATTGTGTVTLGAALSNAFCTFAEASVADAAVVSYLIIEGNNFEVGRGTYTAAGPTLSRDTVLLSKIGGTAGTTKMTLAGAAEVRLATLAEDIGGGSDWTRATEQATTTGTAKDFTGIPAGVSEIVVSLMGVSTDVNAAILVQIGTASGIEATGYDSGVATVTSTIGIILGITVAATTTSGPVTLYRTSGNKWVAGHAVRTTSGGDAGGGYKALSAELTQLRITLTTGNFDAGAVNIMYR